MQELDEATAKDVRRLDQAIQRYELQNDRGHLVYANVEMPANINASNVEGYARNQFEPGSLVEFDRYTGATHCLHELEPGADTASDIAFEISTTRGMYMGSSDSTWNTPHLLPRSLALYSHGVQKVTYVRPDGSTGTRVVVQLADTPPEGVKVVTVIDRYERIKAQQKTYEISQIRKKNKAEREAKAARAAAGGAPSVGTGKEQS